jgi:hypothetical protein
MVLGRGEMVGAVGSLLMLGEIDAVGIKLPEGGKDEEELLVVLLGNGEIVGVVG